MKELIKVARPFYKATGSNQWPHILRVLSQGTEIATRLGFELSRVDFAALLFHDVAKSRMGEFPGEHSHGRASAIMAREILKGYLSIDDIEIACSAIAEHEFDVVPSSKTSDLLMSSDANKPELLWILRKSFYKSSSTLGLSGEAQIINVFNHVKKRAICSGRQHVPELYASAFSDEIEKIKNEAAKLCIEDITAMVAVANEIYADMDVLA